MDTAPGPRRARDLMTSPVLTVPPDAPRAAVAALLVSHGIASAPVVDARGRLLGVVDERRLVGADDDAPAAELMTHVPTADPDTPVEELVDRLLDTGCRALPILREEIPVGVVSRRDVLRRVARGELDVRGTHAAADAPVVVGVDGSDESVQALRWAAGVARAEGAPLVALIASGPPDLYGDAGDLTATARRELESAVRRALGDDAAERVRLTLEVREGRPARVLLRASEEARMLVLGTRHVEGLGDPPGGSVTARLVSRAWCPVVAVVPVPEEGPAYRVDDHARAVPTR
ncbi:CBS domain-containing protein [Actinomycetospora straminea]|uniref:CBS domain-containing protein n=1 Tax=Actinomycetospora straminea TaxID=663607 RepID=A0ABP9EMH5_9PSEU|nr:CBS domain-containing protein [Actinomycetospora straminea]MDD7933234.1 CBS domain-containing protein [Actinomycetospora straminea]